MKTEGGNHRTEGTRQTLEVPVPVTRAKSAACHLSAARRSVASPIYRARGRRVAGRPHEGAASPVGRAARRTEREGAEKIMKTGKEGTTPLIPCGSQKIKQRQENVAPQNRTARRGQKHKLKQQS